MLDLFLACYLMAASLSGTDAAIASYLAELRAVEGGSRAASVETAFHRAQAVADALLMVSGDKTVLEHATDAQFDRLNRSLPGLRLNRDEVVFAKPDAVFFLGLARTRGSADDRAFFRTYLQVYPASVWPSYVQQQTDSSGCTDFGSGELVARYDAWLAYRHQTTHYASTVNRELHNIEQEVTTSTCACGSRESVLRELQRFATRFPDSPVSKTVASRSMQIRSGRSPIRFSCISG